VAKKLMPNKLKLKGEVLTHEVVNNCHSVLALVNFNEYETGAFHISKDEVHRSIEEVKTGSIVVPGKQIHDWHLSSANVLIIGMGR